MIEPINSKNIKQLREKLDWSQESLARELSVSVNTIRRWEKGTNEPSTLAKKALLDLLKRTNTRL
jgi:DNA-binding transcriptional regulator YiaG